MTVSAGKRKLKILFFSQRFPYPMDTGGKIRTGKLLERLHRVFDITLVSNMESPKDNDYFHEIKTLCSEFYPVSWKEVKKYSLRFYLKLLARLVSRYPITVINDYSRNLEKQIIQLLERKQFDLLVCDFLQPSLNFRKVNGYPTLLFEHNVESVLVRRHFERARSPVGKLFWWFQWIKMHRYERLACQKFKGIVTVSEVDKQFIAETFRAANVFAIPTGIDTEYFYPREDRIEENSLVFTGSMDWLPNEDAILFFAREILRKIKEQIPTIKLTVVGRNPSRRLVSELRGHPGVEVIGWVKDVRPFIASHALYVVPLRIGGGTRIKVYEAMAMGKAVVSTRVGIEGLGLEDGEHVVLADSAEEFAQAVVTLLRDKQTRRRIEIAARALVRQNFSWEKAAEIFAGICWKTVSV